MAVVNSKKGVIGILTGGGDVPGLNPAIRAVTIRALREGYEVIGLRRGWAGLIDIVRDQDYDNSNNFQVLTEELVNRAGRTGGTFLHTSRTNPGNVQKPTRCRDHLKDATTPAPQRPHRRGAQEPGLARHRLPDPHRRRRHPELRRAPATRKASRSSPSPRRWTTTCPAPTTASASAPASPAPSRWRNRLRTSAGSHERLLVMEVFGRYAGFTAMLPTMAGAANRCVIPEHKFNIEHLTELLIAGPQPQPQQLLGRAGLGGRHVRGRRDGLAEPDHRRLRPREAGRHRRPGLRRS